MKHLLLLRLLPLLPLALQPATCRLRLLPRLLPLLPLRLTLLLLLPLLLLRLLLLPLPLHLQLRLRPLLRKLRRSNSRPAQTPAATWRRGRFVLGARQVVGYFNAGAHRAQLAAANTH